MTPKLAHALKLHDGGLYTGVRIPLRVLLIEDDVDDATITQDALRQLRGFACETEWIATYVLALQALKTKDYDIVLLDHRLGARTGLDLLADAFDEHRPVPVVLLTGVVDDGIDRQAVRAGVAHLLEKGEMRPVTLERSIGYALERSRAERELRSTRAFFHAAFDALQDDVAILDAAGEIIAVNRAWERFALSNGYVGADAGRGSNYLTVCEGGTAAAAGGETACVGIRGVLDGTLDRFEMPYQCHAANVQRWFLMRVSRFHDAGKTRVLVAHENVSERYVAEQALRGSETHYRILFHRNPLPMMLVEETTGIYLDVNDAAIAHYGYTRAEFLAMTALDLRAPRDRAAYTAAEAAHPKGRAHRYATRHMKKSGDIIEVDIVAHPLEHDGRTAFLVVATDMTERNAAERARAAAHATLEAVVSASPIAIVTTGPDDRVMVWNAAAEAMFGWTAPEVTGKPVPHVPASRMAEFHFVAKERAAGRSVTNLETQRSRKDGTLVDVVLSTKSLRDQKGANLGAVGMFSDITDRKRLEREREQLVRTLEFERSRLAAMFEQAPTFIVVFRGPDHIIELANEAYYKIVGRRDIIGQPAREALPEIVSNGLLERLDHVLNTGEPFTATQMPIMLQRVSGGALEERYVSFVYQPFEEADGSRSGVLAQGYDVTDQVTAAVTVRESEARYRALVELSPDGIVIHDWRVVRFANRAALTFVGASAPEDLIGQPVMRFIHEESRSSVERRLEMMDGHGPVTPITQRWTNLQGKSSEMEVVSMPFMLGKESLVQTVFRDVTERHLLEEQLRQSQKMEGVGQLAGGIAHDFNNLLMVIQANTEFLLEDLDAVDPRRTEALEIRAASERAAGMTRQLLAFSRKQILEPRALDMREIVAGVKSMLARTIGEDIEVEARSADSIGMVMADPGQVEQVLMNLILNARDAMPGGGRILVETSDVTLSDQYAVVDRSEVLPGEYVVLSVSDNGSGMTAEVRDRIFEPYFTTKPIGHGTGLGLATVYGIIKQSGGHIWVYSEPGAGTAFKVYFPRLGDVRVATAAAQAIAPPVRGTETVLLVEDEPSLRGAAKRMLIRQGYHVLEASNGREALQVASQHPGDIHLVLTDVVMPEMSGGVLAERLLAVRPQARVLFMTGYTDGDIVRRGVLKPGVSLVQKPFSAARLSEMVRKTLDE